MRVILNFVLYDVLTFNKTDILKVINLSILKGAHMETLIDNDRNASWRNDYEVLNTEQMLALLTDGQTLEIYPTDMSILEDLDIHAGSLEIESIEYTGEEEVQCIMVDDDDHMYVTDDGIATHNTSNIVFLKSTDDTMIETLSKMSGTTHTVYKDSKTVTKDVERFASQNEGKVSYTMTAKEEPVISYNDLNSLSVRNSIVFRAGDPPIWNRNEMILPMSWKLFSNKITYKGRAYTLQTIPTLSSAIDFDVRKNQPDFTKMLIKRIEQAVNAPKAMEKYATTYNLNDYDIAMMDPDVYAGEVMEIVSAMVLENRRIERLKRRQNSSNVSQSALHDGSLDEVSSKSNDPLDSQVGDILDNMEQYGDISSSFTDNKELEEKINEYSDPTRTQKRFAGGKLSPNDLYDKTSGGQLYESYNIYIIEAFIKNINGFRNDPQNRFLVEGPEGQESLKYRSESGFEDAITFDLNKLHEEEEARAQMQGLAQEDNNRVYEQDAGAISDLGDEITRRIHSYHVNKSFVMWLSDLPTWKDIANGDFENDMANRVDTGD